jgi:hypothetical protein
MTMLKPVLVEDLELRLGSKTLAHILRSKKLKSIALE